MKTDNKNTSDFYSEVEYLFRHFFVGLKEVTHNPAKGLALLLFVAAYTMLWAFRKKIFGLDGLGMLARPLDAVVQLLLLVLFLFLAFVILALMGTPQGSRKAKEALQKIGLQNAKKETPTLESKTHDEEFPCVIIFEFTSCGIPLEKWEDMSPALEAALRLTIAKVAYAKGKSRVLVYAVPADVDLPKVLMWNDGYLSSDSFVLTLGESYLGSVTANLSDVHHILLGGATGSGKSMLLKLLLMQALHKGAEVYVADFKGGVDFPKIWHKKCRMCFTEEDLLDMLNQLVDTLEYRKRLLHDADFQKIDTYNADARKKGKAELPRLIFACDEVAELMDKTGRSKADKELLAEIESRLTTIARQGRAFGIHLILATQRPDATVIPGQIRSNCLFRVCGRADTVLSEIILDNGSAAEKIPKDAKGRFITMDGTVFQAYLFDEEQI